MTDRRRRSGILLHPTSLPGEGATGALGRHAHRFLDFLEESGQALWQVLPLVPPGPGQSPYASPSAFAGDARLISLEFLEEDGLLPHSDVTDETHEQTLLRAFDASRGHPDIARFAEGAAAWLPDWSLFQALRDRHGAPWTAWPDGLRSRFAAALEEARREHAEAIAFHSFVQFCMWRQWDAIHARANDAGIEIIGDLPIVVSHDSADVWANQRLFKLDGKGLPTAVAGVPPDLFSETGQLWGNPLYRWDVLRDDGYGWWVERMRWTLRAFDHVRIDHFRGFAAMWEVPISAPTAETGAWEPGPGVDLFRAMRAQLGQLPLIAEDLGLITDDVVALRHALDVPGMAVLQFAFDGGADNPYLPYNLVRDQVIYTGTHDNDTTAGWLAGLDGRTRWRVAQYVGTPKPGVDDLIRLALASVCDVAVIPMQDILGLGAHARMNLPGRSDGNWQWRFSWDDLPAGRAQSLRELTDLFGRIPSAERRKGPDVVSFDGIET